MLQGQAAICLDSIYPGFDSRLKPAMVGRLPQGREAVVGFEVSRGKTIVAFPNLLLGFEKLGSMVTLPSTEAIQGIAIDSAGNLSIQTSASIQQLGKDRLVENRKLGVTRGKLLNSGNPVFMDASAEEGFVHFVARRPDGSGLPIAEVKGKYLVASWNQLGLAAVVEESVLVWPSGSEKLLLLAADTGLSSARDICLVGPNRVVVALKNVVLLLTGDTQTILVAMSARCRWENGILFLLDEKGGFIWAVRGLENVGRREADRQHAVQLIRSSANDMREDNRAFLEAARILGCEEARRIRDAARVSP